jgi:hypothetical protein
VCAGEPTTTWVSAGLRASGCEIGWSAVVAGVSVLDLARIHPEVLFEVVRDTPSEALDDVAAGALEFFLEVLRI